MTETTTVVQKKTVATTVTPWNVVVADDPVNLMNYVTHVLMKIFGYGTSKATRMMMEVHQRGRSIVWTGEREKAELFTQQLQLHQLKATLEKAE